MNELAARLDGAVFTAHNVGFDWAFIERDAHTNKITMSPSNLLCTLRMSRKLDPDRMLSHRLADVCERYGIGNDRPHDALHDARATALILPSLLAAHDIHDVDRLATFYERR